MTKLNIKKFCDIVLRIYLTLALATFSFERYRFEENYFSFSMDTVSLNDSKVNSMVFPGGSVVKNPPADAGDPDLIPGSGRSPQERNGNLFQYSCLGNPMDSKFGVLQSMGLQSQTRLSN